MTNREMALYLGLGRPEIWTLVGSENGSSVFFLNFLWFLGLESHILFSLCLEMLLKNVFTGYIGLIFSALNIFKGLCFLLLTWLDNVFSYDFIVIFTSSTPFKRPITFWEDHMAWWPAWQTQAYPLASIWDTFMSHLVNQLRPLLQLHLTVLFSSGPIVQLSSEAFHLCLHLWESIPQ